MKHNTSVFGTDLKYILALTALAWITYTMPSVRAALETSYAPQDGYAAVSTVSVKLNSASTSISSVKTPAIKADVKVEVVGQPKLDLKYNSSKKESSLQATFMIKVSGGSKGVYVDVYQPVHFDGKIKDRNTSHTVYARLAPMVRGIVSQTGKALETYYVPANKTVIFGATASVNPQIMFGGTYTTSMREFNLYSSSNAVTGYQITLPANISKPKVIVGELSPYIYSVTNPVSIGDKVVVSGTRLNDSGAVGFPSVFIDDQKVSGVDGAKDGSVVFFVLASTTSGVHSLYVENLNGKSNTHTLNVLNGDGSDDQQTNCFTFSTNLSIGSAGEDVVALQQILISKGFWPTGGSEVDAMGQFGSTTLYALKVYQSSKGLPETGFVGPLTRAALNSECDTNPPIVVCPVGFICTPGTSTEPQVVNCPAGYVCSEIDVLRPSFISQSSYVTAGDNANDDVGTFSITFRITAQNGDVYIPINQGFVPVQYVVEKSGYIVDSSSATAALELSMGSENMTSAGNIHIAEGTTEQFKLNVVVPMGYGLGAGQYRVSMNGITWDSTDGTASNSKQLWQSGFENFRTSYLYLN